MKPQYCSPTVKLRNSDTTASVQIDANRQGQLGSPLPDLINAPHHQPRSLLLLEGAEQREELKELVLNLPAAGHPLHELLEIDVARMICVCNCENISNNSIGQHLGEDIKLKICVEFSLPFTLDQIVFRHRLMACEAKGLQRRSQITFLDLAIVVAGIQFDQE